MNRNELYHYLKDIGLFGVIHHGERGYHFEFVEDATKNLEINAVRFDWGYLRNVKRIHLCANELVLEGNLTEMKVNVFYRHINEFEVEMIEKEE